MKRRKANHDYYGVSIYMITLVIQDRRPLLGELKYDKESLTSNSPKVYVKYSDFGSRVKDAWNKIPLIYPGIRTYRCEIMPDHIHGILHVTQPMKIHLSVVINGFITGVRKIYREMFPFDYNLFLEWRKYNEDKIANKEIEEKGCVFEIGYCDSILSAQGQLNKWYEYLRANPFRLAMKRAFPDLFSVKYSLRINGKNYDSLGNRFLATMPWKIQIRVSRSASETEIIKYIDDSLALAEEGAVLISPAISKGEKRVMRAALNAGYACIYIDCNGFDSYTKVPFEFTTACMEGRLLIISDIIRVNTNRLGREECLRLNSLAAEIATKK